MISLSVKVFFSARWREAMAGNFGGGRRRPGKAIQRDAGEGDRESREIRERSGCRHCTDAAAIGARSARRDPAGLRSD